MQLLALLDRMVLLTVSSGSGGGIQPVHSHLDAGSVHSKKTGFRFKFLGKVASDFGTSLSTGSGLITYHTDGRYSN